MNLFRVWPEHQCEHEDAALRYEALIADLESKLARVTLERDEAQRERDTVQLRLAGMQSIAKHAIDALNATHCESPA